MLEEITYAPTEAISGRGLRLIIEYFCSLTSMGWILFAISFSVALGVFFVLKI